MPFEPVQIAPVSTFHGESAAIRVQNGREIRPAPRTDSFNPYKAVSKRNPKRCTAKNGTCKGWKVKGEEYCVGHLKSKEA